MFRFDRGLRLLKADLAIDCCRRQPRAFVSHAHSDHMARHEFALCTPATSRLYQLRYGPRPTRHLPYRQPIEWGGLRLTTYPAGHCLGSAMLLAEDGHESLLYTGDFKLGESATAERAELPQAHVLVIESTYGDPLYRLQPRDQVVEMFLDLVRQTLARGLTPVIKAYALGKGQEVTKILTAAGIPVLQHPVVYEVSQAHGECGVELGDVKPYPGYVVPGHAVIVPPRAHRGGRLAGLKRCVTFAVTGWAAHWQTRFRLGVDHAIPLSDHADFNELIEAVVRVSPRVVYCTHGPESFVDHLRARGFNARPLAPSQTWLSRRQVRQTQLF